MLHKTAMEHHEKLKRVTDRINTAVHKDDLDDFFKTAYHLIEITKRDPATSATQKSAAKALRNDVDLQICRDICNGQKHFTLDPKKNPKPKVLGTTTQQGFGVGGYSKGGYGVGEQSVTIQLSDGTERNARDLVASIAGKWWAIL